jgi:hypothetical protein
MASANCLMCKGSWSHSVEYKQFHAAVIVIQFLVFFGHQPKVMHCAEHG